MEVVHDAVLGLDGELAYAVIGVLAFTEAAAFLGLFVPGELAVLVGGGLASQGRVSLPVLVAVVAVAAVAGDSAGYEIGRRHGRRLLAWAPVAGRVGGHAEAAEAYLATRGGWLVFAGRWTGILRAVVPGIAGMMRMPYRTFLAWNVAGGVAWAAVFVTLGYLAGSQIERVAGWSAAVGVAVAAGLAVVLVARWHRRSRRPAAALAT
jgi:membrane-associated protein